MLSENPVNSTIKAATVSFHALVENFKSGHGLYVATCVVSQKHMRSVCVCVYARLMPPANATVEYHLAFMVNPVWGQNWKQLKLLSTGGSNGDESQ